jgi:hypothetical protein
MKASDQVLAVSAVQYDILLQRELERRLADHLTIAARLDDAAPESGPVTSAHAVLVLHQRLWGHTELTGHDSAALADRLKADPRLPVFVARLDDAALPAFLRKARVIALADLGMDGAAESIVALVAAPAGKPATRASRKKAAQDAPVMADLPPLMDDEDDGSHKFMASPRASTVLRKELDMMADELDLMAKAAGATGQALTVQRTPNRVTVQLGEVGLSMSWIAARNGAISDGSLMVIEWDGAMSRGGVQGTRTATVRSEQTFRACASCPEDWRWSAEGQVREFSSRHLARQFLTSVSLPQG